MVKHKNIFKTNFIPNLNVNNYKRCGYGEFDDTICSNTISSVYTQLVRCRNAGEKCKTKTRVFLKNDYFDLIRAKDKAIKKIHKENNEDKKIFKQNYYSLFPIKKRNVLVVKEKIPPLPKKKSL